MDHPQVHRSCPRSAGFRGLFGASAFAILLIAVVIPGYVSAAGAADGCGTYSYGFEGTRLLNDGISNVSGPYELDLPAGTYTVTLVAHDHHDRQVGVPTQPGEQYVVELDSGYTSPASNDIPDDLIMTTTVFTQQKIAASTAITVRHNGAPGINSVDVICVGFTPESADVPTVDPNDPADEATDPADEAIDPADEEPSLPEEPEVPGVVFPTPTDPPVDPSVETPTQDIGDPVGIVREPEPAEPLESDPVEPEVLGVIESPPVAPQLAITGPADHAASLLTIGGILVLLGALLVRRQRRWDASV